MSTNGYSEYVPTRTERFWRWCGYHARHPEVTEEAEKLPGWMMTNIIVHVSLADRVRLLIGGRIRVRVETRSTGMIDHAISASSVELMAPGAP